MKDCFKKTVYHEKKFEPKGMNKQKGNNKREGTNENETYRTIQAFFLLLIVLMLCYQGIRNGNLQYDLLENGETRYGYATYQKKEGTFVSLTLGYSFHRSIVYTVTAIMFFYSLISKNPGWSLPMIILYFADLVCDVSYAIIAVCLFFRKFHLSTASFYTTLILLLITGEIWAWLGVLRLYEYRTYK
ncbi:hypothetical protein HZH66_008881 [Vespula vulgaris]|uniref:Uncharacterized protein n=1 Tax=Vespula vulgaris TaxID=7454 RepID=A0A834N3L9_VESVU|nr:hypothetical protein HZH66_008881 [Vespula vulgaris]